MIRRLATAYRNLSKRGQAVVLVALIVAVILLAWLAPESLRGIGAWVSEQETSP